MALPWFRRYIISIFTENANLSARKGDFEFISPAVLVSFCGNYTPNEQEIEHMELGLGSNSGIWVWVLG